MTSINVVRSSNREFFNQGFRLELIYSRKKAVEETDKKEILKERDNTTSKKTKILLAWR